MNEVSNFVIFEEVGSTAWGCFCGCPARRQLSAWKQMLNFCGYVQIGIYRVALTNWPHLNEMCFTKAKCKMRNRRVNKSPALFRLWEEDLEV